MSATDVNLGPLIWQLALHAAPWVILFAGVSLILALVACIALHRERLLQRHRRGWHLAAKLSYAVILLALPLAGAALGTIYGTQRAFANFVHTELVPVMEQHVPALRIYVASQLSAYQPGKPASVRELIAPLVQQLSYQPRSDSWWERTKAHWINDVLLQHAAAQLARVLQEQLTAQLMRVGSALDEPDVHGQAGSSLARLGSDVALKLTTNMAREIDFTILDKSLPKAFANALIRQFSRALGTARSMVLVILLGLFLLVAIEIVIYRRYFKPASMMVSATAPSTPTA